MSTTVGVTRTSFDRMVAKSEEQTRAGNLPRLLRVLSDGPEGAVLQVWSVSSRTVAGEVRIVEVTIPYADQEPLVTCDCPAANHCWHRMHVLRALNGEVPYYRTPERTLDVTRRLAGDVLPVVPGINPGPAASY